jgi:chromosome partitioning protein
LNKDVESAIKNQFKSKVFNTTIRDNVALAEAPVARKDIFEYNRKSNGAKDYQALTREIAKKYQLVC